MNAKRHHYVPETYLNPFRGDDGKLTVFRKSDPAEPFRVAPSNIALERYYYAFTREDGTRDSDTLEQTFSQAETQWPSIVSQLSCGSISEQITHDLLQFACLQRARVPAVRDAFELMRADATLLNAKLLQRLGKLPDLPAGSEDLLDRVVVSIDPESSLKAIELTIGGMADRVLPLLGFMVVHNQTRVDFITSDNPVMYFIPRKDEALTKPYEIRPGAPLEFLFPLTPRMLLLGRTQYKSEFDADGLLHAEIGNVQSIRRANRFIAKFGYNLVMAKDSSSAQLVSKYADISPVMHTTAFPRADGQTVMVHMEFSKRREKTRWKPEHDS
jgi:hypothetical protein